MGNPYIISAELDLPQAELVSVVNRAGIDTFREGLDADLRAMGKDLLWVPSGDLRTGIEERVAKTRLPVISLDDRYVRNTKEYLGISRGVNEDLSDAGYASRAGYGPIPEQLDMASKLGKELVVADDVLFSGEMMSWLDESLRAKGSRIAAVITGIAIQEGIDKLGTQGIDVEAAYIFEDVEDEICERDFAFVPGSGRRVTNGANALYFDPQFGRPAQWASLDQEQVSRFGVASLERSLRLLAPDVPALQVGRFIGYSTDGTAQNAITNRMEQLR